MALFQRKQQTPILAPLYTTSAERTVLLVGLGNPGDKYTGTKHNVGFVCLDAFAEAHEFPAWTTKRDLKSRVTVKVLGSSRVILCKPSTYMNLSGDAVQKAAHFYKIPQAQIVAIYDELDIPFGQIRIRTGGSAAGHNGVRSLIQQIGQDFGRIRIGIGEKPKNAEGAAYVLTAFSKKQQAEIPNLLRETTSMLTEYIYQGALVPETRSFIS